MRGRAELREHHARAHTDYPHANTPPFTLHPDTCPCVRRPPTTPGRGAQSTGRAQSCGTKPTLVLARISRPGRPTAGAARRPTRPTTATLRSPSIPPGRTPSTSVSRRAVSPLLPGVCSPMPSGGPRKSRAPPLILPRHHAGQAAHHDARAVREGCHARAWQPLPLRRLWRLPRQRGPKRQGQ